LKNIKSGFVTAASDGIVNFWSLSNLIEPAESLKIPGGNLTSISVAPESQSIIAGDECGSLYAIVSSSTTTSGGGRSSTSSSTSRRTVRKLNNSKKDPGNSDLYHYGPVTGLSTRVTSNSNKTDGVSLSRGFARGAKGMVLTCGVDWTTKLWAPAYSDKPLLSLLSHSYDYMCDVQW
jgi:dynein intermediate chain